MSLENKKLRKLVYKILPFNHFVWKESRNLEKLKAGVI